MGVDGGEYSLCRKRGVEVGGHVCRAGFLCETARGNFRVGNTIKNRTRQSRAPLCTVAGTRAAAERPVFLDFACSVRATACAPIAGELSKKPLRFSYHKPLSACR